MRIRIINKVIYFDPAYLTTYFSGYDNRTEFSRWPDPIDGLPNGLEKADYIFITHHHKDHCKRVTTQRLISESTKVFAPKSCEKELENMYVQVKPGDHYKLDNQTAISVINAYNTESGSSTRKQHKKGKGVGYLLDIADWTIYHAGDTDFISDMTTVKNVDIAMIPIGGKFTMDVDEAMDATLTINPKIVIPIHHLDVNPDTFCSKLANRSDIQCIVPGIGEPIDILK